ncbi:hypothetical protein EON80_09070 [bacterium]|nr:MAG: hypothetical protein EON80_09070 [bacterium]
MGKAWIKLRMPDEIFVGFLDQVATNLGRHNSREAHFSLPEPVPPGGSFTNVHIALRGHDFTYKNGALVGGIVTKVTYEDEDGNESVVLRIVSAIKVSIAGMMSKRIDQPALNRMAHDP